MSLRTILIGFSWVPALVLPLRGDEPEIVTIRGEQHKVWPVDDLRARGFEVREIPREKNAAWTYIEAINAYEELPPSLDDAFTYSYKVAWLDRPELTEYLKLPGNRRAMELARKAARVEECQIPYFGDPQSSVVAILLPNLAGWRMVGKIFVADGKRLEWEADYDAAMDNYLTTMRMGAQASRGQTLIEGLVGLAIWTLADRAAVDMVLRRPLTAKQLKTLARQLDAHAPQLPTIECGLKGERAVGPAMVDELCARPFQLLGNLSNISSGGEDLGWFSGVSPNLQDGWSRLEFRVGRLLLPDRAVKGHMLGYYDRVIERAKMGPVEAAATGFDEEHYLTHEVPRWDFISRMLMPSLARATTLGERAKAALAALRTVVAIRLYMLEHYGKPPATLEDLTDILPQQAMIDPFSGNLLVYRRGDEGWTLYSVGPNLVDDGGRQGTRWDELDMVYRLPPEPIKPFTVEDEGKP